MTGKLFTLHPDTLVYPAHDYNGRRVSTIAQEIARNPRFKVAGKAEFVKLMAGLNLKLPKLMQVAVSANERCGAETVSRINESFRF